MSELRKDLVSGDWIILAPERARRPKGKIKKKKRVSTPRKDCPFEDPGKTGNWPPILSYPNDKAWRVIMIKNKYPALTHKESCSQFLQRGPHVVKSGVGEHDLVITKDHNKTLADLNPREFLKIFELLQQRYRDLAKDKCSVYTSAFFNWGPTAGASLYHPHCQVVTLPIVPPDISHSLEGSRNYFEAHKKCVHCVMLQFDLREGKRILEANSAAVAIAPFISRAPFEIRIFPRQHLSRFESTPLKTLTAVTKLLRSALRKIRKNLGDPDLNFFIHTAPLKGSFDHYHWHIEIVPKITTWGGFEVGTGIEINVVDPEMAIDMLKGRKVR